MAKNPKVNGHVKSFASIKLHRDATEFFDFTEINYKLTVERGEAWASGTKMRGYTRGRVKAEGSAKFHIDEWRTFRDGLGPGYLNKIFPLVVVYEEEGDDVVHTDELVGVRIAGVDKSNSEGVDSVQVTVELHLLDIIEDGIPNVEGEDEAGAA